MNRTIKPSTRAFSFHVFCQLTFLCFISYCALASGGQDAAATFHKTVWSSKTELFMNYDPPVIGKLGGFVIQLTNLSTFKPLSEGKVSLRLIAANGQAVAERLKFSGKPGIFQGAIAPSQAGLHRFEVKISSKDYNDIIGYDGLLVRQEGEAISEAGHPKTSSVNPPIPFLKEQQWAVEFGVQQPEKRDMPSLITVSGELAANPTAEVILSAPLAGMLAFDKSISHLGQRVVKGQELCHIEPPVFQNGGADQLTAQLAEAKNKVLLAKKEFDRAKRLVEGKAAPRKRLEEAEIMLKIANSNLKPLSRALSRIQSGSACGHLILKAPISGTVVEVNAVNGEYLQAGQPLLRIVDTSKLWLKANVPVAESMHQDHLATANFTISGNNKRFKPTRLVTISDVIDPKTRTVQAIFEVNNPNAEIKIGMFANIFLRNGMGENLLALAIPSLAIHEDEGKHFVYIQSGGETFARREVTLGNKVNGLTAIASGLTSTDRVVTKGGYYVKQASQSSKTPEGHGHEH